MIEKNITREDFIEELASEKRYSELRDVLMEMNAADIAACFERIGKRLLPLLFRLLPKELAAETFVEMQTDMQELLIRSFSDNELRDVVEELYIDDAADIVEEMPANVVKRILKAADPAMRYMINEILKYPEDSAGSMMTIEYVSLRPTMTVEDAMKRIKRTGVDKETIYTCYVTDDMRRLLGLVTAKTLLLSELDEVVGEIMETNIISVHTSEDREVVAQLFNKYSFLSIPVVDDENRLVGIVTFDDAIDVLQEEATEDIEKMAAITPSDKPYMRTSAFELYRSRIPWLLILMVSATFTSMILTYYETALAAVTALTAFIPMLMDTAGNSGSQSSVTIIRGLSLGEIRYSDTLKIVWKELRVSVMCGLTLAVFNFAKLMLFDRVGVLVSLTVCTTLAVTVIMAKFVGCSLPILAKRIGFDPAVMASPFITTIVDALALLVYFQVASRLLGI